MARVNIEDIIKKAQAGQDEANRLNQERSDSLLGRGSIARYAESGGLFNIIGQSARQDVRRQGEKTLASGTQDLISSGLFNTTRRQNLKRAVANDQNRANLSISDAVARLMGGVIERQNNVAPDTGLYADLVRQAAGVDTSPVTATVGGRSGGGGSSGGGFGGSSSGSSGGGGGGGGRPTVQTFGAGGRDSIGPTALSDARKAARGSNQRAGGPVANADYRMNLFGRLGMTGPAGSQFRSIGLA